ncbi:MAG: helix-turn-helix transcriptional regulator [Clostridia bacterium]|nr:helix-turn-helix transcriptional regulator [Clostridia bacterium]
MTLGEKLREIRKRFGLSQEQLAEIMNVSRQAITKWENDGGLPDVSNLQELSKVFGITVDYLLNNDNKLPLLVMRKELDKNKYKGKLSSYEEILKEFFPEPYEVYSLIRKPKMNKLEHVLDLLTGGINYSTIKDLSDLSPYYLVKKDNLNLLVNIKDWTLEVKELSSEINSKKFTIDNNKFTTLGKIKI